MSTDELCRHIEAAFDVSVDSSTSLVDDLGFDSVELLEVAALCAELGYDFPEDFDESSTVGDLAAALRPTGASEGSHLDP